MRKVLVCALFSSLLAAVPTFAGAQECSDVLIANITETSTDRYSTYAYYNLIDTEEEYAREKSGSGSGDFLGLISGSGSFTDYMERRNRQLSITSMSMESAFAERVLLSSVSEDKVGAWLACMRESSDKPLIIYLDDISNDFATLVISWDHPREFPDAKIDYASFIGLRLPGSDDPISVDTLGLSSVFSDDRDIVRQFERVDCGEIRVSIELGTYVDSVVVPACPVEPPDPIPPAIQTQIFPVTGTPGTIPTARSCLPEGWKLIGGGAHVDYGNSQGLLLTASYPDGRCWVAAAKAHTVPASGTVTAFAIGLFDPSDEWSVETFSTTGSVTAFPQALASVAQTYVLTGCGGRIDWTGYGNLLTGLYPSSRITCSVFGKQHYSPDPAAATAYAIGIRPRNGAPLPSVEIVEAASAASLRPSAAASLPSNCWISGGGANIDWAGTQGVLLTSSMPAGNGWSASGKAHSVAVNAPIRTYVMGICP